MVYEASRAVEVPVIGMGGIMCAEDAIEFLIAGASAVAVGTATFVDPKAALKVVAGIDAYLERKGFKSVAEIVGALKLK
jgi:dihydroorotate dehydrogenase (NAD+) catalytic subunit